MSVFQKKLTHQSIDLFTWRYDHSYPTVNMGCGTTAKLKRNNSEGSIATNKLAFKSAPPASIKKMEKKRLFRSCLVSINCISPLSSASIINVNCISPPSSASIINVNTRCLILLLLILIKLNQYLNIFNKMLKIRISFLVCSNIIYLQLK